MHLEFSLQTEIETMNTEVFIGYLHNDLQIMAQCAGIHTILWKPRVNQYKYARNIMVQLGYGLMKLESDPNQYKVLNPPLNGHGTYENLLDFVKRLMKVCYAHPNAEIHILGEKD